MANPLLAVLTLTRLKIEFNIRERPRRHNGRSIMSLAAHGGASGADPKLDWIVYSRAI